VPPARAGTVSAARPDARNIDIAVTIDPMRSLGIIDDETVMHIWLVASSSTNLAATARCTRSIKTIVNT
jgi:hypothetical protein